MNATKLDEIERVMRRAHMKAPPKYWYRYSQVDRHRWHALIGVGYSFCGDGISARTEKRLRRKIARWLLQERLKNHTKHEWRQDT